MQRDNISTVGDNISIVEGIQYCGGNFSTVGGKSSTCGGWIVSVLWGIPSVLWRVFSTVGDNISTVGDSFNTVEDIQCIGWIPLSTCGDNISTLEGIQYSGDTFSTVEDTFSTVGIPSVQWGNISTVEVAQYSGDKDLKYCEESRNFFQSLFRFENQRSQVRIPGTPLDRVLVTCYRRFKMAELVHVFFHSDFVSSEFIIM